MKGSLGSLIMVTYTRKHKARRRFHLTGYEPFIILQEKAVIRRNVRFSRSKDEYPAVFVDLMTMISLMNPEQRTCFHLCRIHTLNL